MVKNMTTDREDWPVHQPDAPEAPIPGRHWYSGCNPDLPRVNPATGKCEDCGGAACPECGRENCPDHDGIMTALIAVDVQNDFLPGGALAVPDGGSVIPELERLAKEVDVVFTTQDWHPEDHCSFGTNGGIWPTHCVQFSNGAALHARIDALVKSGGCVYKGTRDEAYSGFDGTGLADWLRRWDVERVIIGGLATEYCVKATAIDAAREGFQTTVKLSACAGISEEDSRAAAAEMREAGVEVID